MQLPYKYMYTEHIEYHIIPYRKPGLFWTKMGYFGRPIWIIVWDSMG